MSIQVSWIRKIFGLKTLRGRGASRHPGRKNGRPGVERLEDRLAPATITTASNVLTYTAGAGVNNNISVTVSGSNFVFNDTGETISTSISGATGSGTNTVDVPTASVTGIVLNLADGADTIASSGVVLTTQALTINHTGTGLTISGPLTTTTGAIAISNTGTGDVTDNGAITTTSGAVSISSTNNVFANASINAGSAAITISADTAASGTAGFTQAVGTTLTTTATSSTAVSITVNTAGGGTGNATIGNIIDAGTLVVKSNGGSILWNGTISGNATQVAQLQGVYGAGTAPASTTTINAKTITFTATGSGSIGTSSTPIEGTESASTSTATFSAGSGGVYFVDWGGDALTLNGATATGAGNIRVVTSTGSGDNLTVSGTVNTGSGSIFLAADDNFVISSGVAIGGASFSGTVYCGANRDEGNTGTLTISGTITTSNTTANAVLLEDYGGVTGTVAGTLTLGNITVGNGGTITATTVPTLGTYDTAAPTSNGQIVAASTSVLLNAGATGTVVLTAAAQTGSTDTNGIGTSAIPILVSAGTVNISNTSSITATPATGSVFVTGQSSTTFSAAVGGTAAGTINLTVNSGILTIGGATSTAAGGTITLTATGTSGGITVSAPLGSAGSGAIALSSGANTVLFSSAQTILTNDPVTVTSTNAAQVGGSLTVNGTFTAANGLQVNSGGTLTVNGTFNSTTGLQVNSGGTLTGSGIVNSTVSALSGATVAPNLSATGLNTNDLTLNANGNLQVNLTGTNPGQFSVVNVTGAVTLTGSNLQIEVGGNLSVGDSFEIISNDLTDPVVGTFVGGSTITAANNPLYVFTVNYAGGDGNDVVITVAQIPTVDDVDVVGGTVSFAAPPGAANDVTVSIVGGNYVINDSAVTIALTTNATGAGWSNTNANTVTGPTTGVNNLSLSLNDGNDVVAGLAAGAANVSFTGVGNLTITGPVASTSGNISLSGFGALDLESNITTTGNITISGATDVTDGTSGAPGTLTANTLSLTASDGIGTTANQILTAATTITAAAGIAGVYITQNGSASVTATATGAGNVSVSDLAGTLNIAGLTTTVAGNITLSSAGAVTLGANVGSSTLTGAIAINADTGGTIAAGTAAFDQKAALLTTANTSSTAVVINVNTASGGAGDAVIGQGSVGGNSGGTITVNSNGGNILWSNDPSYTAFTSSQTGTANGGSNTQTLKANNYVFTATGAGTSIGTNARPLQTDSYGAANAVDAANMTLSAGSGGIYVTDWGTNGNNYLTVDSATAVGAGNIRVVTANAGGHDLYIDGPVTTGSGSIALYADDDLILTSRAVVGGATFSGTVDLQGNRDAGNGQVVAMNAGSSILTSNATASAVSIQDYSATGSAGSSTILPLGGVVLGNITTGAGGTVTVIAGAGTAAARGGSIAQLANTLVNVGAAGTVTLSALTISSLNDGNIGTSTNPILVQAGTVNATAIGIAGDSPTSPTGAIFITATGASSITASTTGSSTAVVSLTDSGGVLTIAGPTNSDGGAVTLTDSTGVAVSATLGDSNTGPIAVNGPLSGNSAIQLGTGDLTLTQSTNSSYAGVVSGTDNVVLAGTGTLTLTGTSTYTGTTSVNAGALIVNGSLASSSVTTTGSGMLSGSGVISGPTTVNGFIAPGGGAGGTQILNTGNLSFAPGGTYTVDLNNAAAGPGVGYDQVNVTGTVDLTNATLQIETGAGLKLGDTFIIINNDATDSVVSQFSNGTTIQASNNPSYTFTVNTAGGDGNDVAVTLTNINTALLLDVSNNQVVYSTGAGFNSNVTVSNASNAYTIQDTAGPIGLTANAVNAGWTVSNGVATGPTMNITGLTLNLNDGNDTISGLNGGSANVSVTGSGTLTLTGAVSTTGSLSISGFTTATDNTTLSATNNVTIAGGALALNGSGSISSSGGNISVNAGSSLTIGNGLTFSSTASNGTVAFAAGASSPITLGNITVSNGAVNVSSGSTLTLNGVLTATNSAVTVSGVTDVVAGANENILATTLTVTASDGVGIAANNILTSAVSIVAAAGAGGVYFTTPNGASVAATATGAGNVSITNLAGTLNIAGLTQTAIGNIVLSSADAVTLSANVGGAGDSGTITINADTDGLAAAGTASYNQMGAALTTANTSTSAVVINVNTASTGAGDAVIGQGSIGGNSGGTITVNSNGGNILWSNDPSYTAFTPSQTGISSGGSNTQTLKANNYVFTATGAGTSIGTNARPLQTDSYGAANAVDAANMTLSAGSGGIYVTDWGTNGNNYLTVDSATAVGAGNIRVVTANAGGHDLYIDGPVTTGSGSIALYSDDDLFLTGNAVIGGATFSGTVDIQGNRDAGNGQAVAMNAGSSILTSNATASAVSIQDYSATGGAGGSTIIPNGGVVLSNITTGAGGTVTVVAGAGTASARSGSIAQLANTLVNVGAGGTVTLSALAAGTTTSDGNIGTSTNPILVQAATVNATATGISGDSPTSPTGAIYISATGAASITASTTGSSTAVVSLTDSGGVLTIAGPTNSDGGAVTLTDSAGVAVSATLGDSNTGPIAVNGPLSGNGAIQLGAGDLTLTQSTNSSYAGSISGTGNVVLAGTGTLTLTGTGSYTGTTSVNAGGLIVNGNLSGGNVTTTGSGLLGGSGTISGAAAVNGFIAPGGGAGGTQVLNTGNLSFGSGGTYTVDLNNAVAGPGAGYDQVNVTGTVDLTNAALKIIAGPGLNLGDTFIIINNDATDPVVSQFINGTTIQASNNPLETFTVNTAGGDGNDVALTLTDAPAVTANPSNQMAIAGANTTFTAAAVGVPTPTVQWQVSTDGGVTFTPLSNAGVYSGVNTTTLSITGITAGLNGDEYQAVFSNTGGSTTTTAATLAVNSPPVITNNPTSQTANFGSTATFTAAASNGNPPGVTVQWQISTNAGVSFTNLLNGGVYSGVTTTTLTITGATSAITGDEYRAVFSNSAGLSANTTSATLTVNPAAMLSIPTTYTGTPGTVVPVAIDVNDPLNANDGNAALASATFALSYDPSVFTLSTSDIQTGSLTGNWVVQGAFINATTGQVTFQIVAGTNVATNTPGSLAVLNFHVNADAPKGASPINLLANAQPGSAPILTQLLDANGVAYALSPAPTNASNDTGVDGVVTVTGANIAPTISAPGSVHTTQSIALTFSTGNGNAISVADMDGGTNPETVTLTATHGILSPAAVTGLTVTGAGTGSLSLTGPLTSLNAALNGLVYTPAATYNGADSLTIQINDQGNTGTGGAQTASATVAVSITPTLSIPTTLTGPPGGTVVVPVNINNPDPAGSTGLISATLALNYDPTIFTVSASDVALGSVTAGWNGPVVNIGTNADAGKLTITVFSNTANTSQTGGSLVNITFHIKSTAALGATTIDLANAVTFSNGATVSTELDDSHGALTLHPQPTSGAPFDPGVDGQVVVDPAITVGPASLPGDTVNTAYNQTITATGGTGNKSLVVSNIQGAISGLTLPTMGNNSLTIGGTPTGTGTETFTVTATDSLGVAAMTNYSIQVTSGAATQFLVTAPSSAVAGQSFIYTVQAEDSSGNPTSFSGTVSFTTSDSQVATLPASTLNSNGFGYFIATLETATTTGWTITATAGTLSGQSSAITVTPGAVTHFVVTAPSSTLTLNSTSFTVTAEDQYNNVATGYSGTVAFTSSDGAVSTGSGLPANSTLVNGTGTFTATLKTPGNQTITATDASNSTLVGNSTAIATRGLYVTSFATTPSGFTATFSKVVNLTTLDYYRFSASQSQAPDVAMATVGSTTTNVNGTLLVSSTATQTTITFVATQGVLTNAAKYFVTLTSGAGGIVDTSGEQLAGDANGFLPGTNYVATNLVPASSTTPTLSIPGFARGPNSSAAVQITTNSVSATGIPITLTHAPANTTEVQFTLDFNPALLNVTGPTTGAFTLLNPGTANSTGVANFEYNGPALSTTSAVLGDIVADVPNSAANEMLQKTLLDLPVADIFFNGSVTPASPVQNADGVQVVDYLGETTNNFGVINSVDASNAQAVVTANTTPTTANQPAGLQAFPLADPYLIAGSTGSTTFKVVAADVTGLNRFAVSLSHPFIPTPPTGLTYSSPGPDPTVSLPTNLQVTAGGIVTVPVNIDDPRPAGSSGLTQAELALTYDPSVFSLTSADVQLGTVPASGTGWTLTTQINPLTGQIAIFLESQTPIRSAEGGSLVSIDFHVNPGATLGATPVNLAASVNPTGNAVVWTRVFDTQQEFTLSPAPTNAVSDAGIDGTVIMAPAAALVSAGKAEGGTGTNPATPAEAGSGPSDLPVLPELAATVGSVVVPEEEQRIAALAGGAVVEDETVHAIASTARMASFVMEAVTVPVHSGAMAASAADGLLFLFSNTAAPGALIHETRAAQQVADQCFLDLPRGTMDAGVREDASLENLASQVTQARSVEDNLESMIGDNADTDLVWLQWVGELPALGARHDWLEAAANHVAPQGTVEAAALDRSFAPMADNADQGDDR